MLNFVICDDNLNIVNKLKEMLEIIFVKNDIDAQVSFISDNAKDTLEFETFKSYIAENGIDSNLQSIFKETGISEKNINRYLNYTHLNDNNIKL